MICADTNCLTAYLAGDHGSDIEFRDKLMRRKALVLPPVVLSELLSDPALPDEAERAILALPVLAPQEGYWQRAGRLRAKLAAGGLRVGLADTLIAQSCLDSGAPLLTRDKGFERFRKIAGLKLV